MAEGRGPFDELLLATAGGLASAAAELASHVHGLAPREAERVLLALIHGGHAQVLANLRELCQSLGTPACLTAIGYAARVRRPDLVSLMLPWVPAYALKTEIGNPLGDAAEGGCLACAKILIHAGADPAGDAHDGRSALHRAAAAGQVDMLASLVAHGASLEASGSAGERPIHAAARGSAPAEAIAKLLDLGADGLASMNDGADAAMLCASLRGAQAGLGAEGLRLLISRGLFLDRVDHKGRSALMWAATVGNIACCLLLAELQDPEQVDDLHASPVDRARKLDEARGSGELEALLMGPKRARAESRQISIGLPEMEIASASDRVSRL